MNVRIGTMLAAAALLACFGAHAKVTAKSIDYEHNGEKLQGYLVCR